MLTHDPLLTGAIWRQFQPQIAAALDTEDDINLWSAAIGQVIADAEFLCNNAAASQAVFAEIGRCSHWLRPNQTRWTADGGFAWPSGYGGSGYSRSGLPDFDWSVIWKWAADDHTWECTDKPTGKRRLQLRIAIPSRTTQHNQAAIHTIWRPGCPTTPKHKLRQFYGLRQQEGVWFVTAYQCTDNSAYECRSSAKTCTEQIAQPERRLGAES